MSHEEKTDYNEHLSLNDNKQPRIERRVDLRDTLRQDLWLGGRSNRKKGTGPYFRPDCSLIF